MAQTKDFAGEPAGSIFSDGKKNLQLGENKKNRYILCVAVTREMVSINLRYSE